MLPGPSTSISAPQQGSLFDPRASYAERNGPFVGGIKNEYPQYNPMAYTPAMQLQGLPPGPLPDQYLPPVQYQAPQSFLVKYEDEEMSDDLGGTLDNQDSDSDDDAGDEKKPIPVSNVQLQQLFEDADMPIIEKGIKKGLLYLEKLRNALTSSGNVSEDVDTWVKQIDEIKKQAQYQKTIVGVVGNTGAGKSSVINALLEEERLVPTNCMRACTAVVTEISYNKENDDPYRASIEFISPAEWEKELRVLFQDLMDGSGEVKNKISPESVGLSVFVPYSEDLMKANCSDRRRASHGPRSRPSTLRRQRKCSGMPQSRVFSQNHLSRIFSEPIVLSARQTPYASTKSYRDSLTVTRSPWVRRRIKRRRSRVRWSIGHSLELLSMWFLWCGHEMKALTDF